jgi:hypothetical protein
MDTWQQYDYFPSSVYILDKPEFLENVTTIAAEYLQETKKLKKLDAYRMYQTDNFYLDVRMMDFSAYVANTAWNILQEQGYNMQDKETYFLEMWLQKYYKYGSMEPHVHPAGSYITGFYVLDAPKDSSEIVIHDPRPGKVQLDHSFKDKIYFKLEPGMLMFTNSWLPHSLSRNTSDKTVSVVHFNMGIRNYYPPPPPAEAI